MTCSYEGCERQEHEVSDRCIFHMTAKEKDKFQLWDVCMTEFYRLVDDGDGSFTGFVLKDTVINHRGKGPRGTRFEREIDMSDCHLTGETDLTDTDFHDDVDFSGTRFDTVIFRKCKFKGSADLSGSRYRKADFRNAYFEKGGNFDDCIFEDGDFSHASIQYVSFRRVKLDNVLFTDAQLEFAYFSDGIWLNDPTRSLFRKVYDLISVSDERYIIREEKEAMAKEGKTRENALRRAEGTYRRIKHSLNNEGKYDSAGEFYIHEMRMKRDRYKLERRYLGWLGMWLYAFTTGYGEKWRNVIMTALFIIFSYSIFYYLAEAITRGSANYSPNYWESLYFSFVTFTTLGYGDYRPYSEYQLIAVTEAFIGAFTIALFVLVFGRKVMR